MQKTNSGGPRGKVPTTVKKNENKEITKISNAIESVGTIRAGSDFKLLQTAMSSKKNGLLEIKKAISILHLFLYTSWLINTAPAVYPCEAKQHQFGEFWFLRVALLFTRTKIEYAISQRYNFVENVSFSILA